MIGHRFAVWGTAALPAAKRARRAEPTAAPLPGAAAPAVAGRDYVLAVFRRSVLLQLMLAMALISLAALIYLNQAGKESVEQYAIADMQRQQIELNLQNANLHAAATNLQNLGRIESLAATQLHMTQPAQSSVIWISPVLPRVAPVGPDTAMGNATRRSSPLTWMQGALQFVAAQL
jgi:cell division protein FtsL